MHSDFDPAPTSLDTVLSPEWMTRMLAPQWPDTTVRNVTVVEKIVTQATKVRLLLELDDDRPDVPRALCVKGILTTAQVPTNASIVETMFYRDFAADQPVRVPDCIHAELNEAGDNGVIVMKDLIAGGAHFLTALEPFPRNDLAQVLSQLAALHARTWQGSSAYDRPWVPKFLQQISARPIIPGDQLQAMLDGPRGAHLGSATKDAGRLQQGLQALARRVEAAPGCLVHGDAHAGNIFRTADGEIGVVDWQILQKGHWAQDVAYHIAAVLDPAERRRTERDLLAFYLARLADLGGPHITADEAWANYRAAMIYGYYLWAITRKVEERITHEFVRRLGTAVEDLESFAAVRA